METTAADLETCRTTLVAGISWFSHGFPSISVSIGCHAYDHGFGDARALISLGGFYHRSGGLDAHHPTFPGSTRLGVPIRSCRPAASNLSGGLPVDQQRHPFVVVGEPSQIASGPAVE